MTADPRRTKIVRTMDGLRFSVETDERYPGHSEGQGELSRGVDPIGFTIGRVIESVSRHVDVSTRALKGPVKIEFSLKLDPEAGLVVSTDRNEGHFFITMEIAPSDEEG